MLRYQEMVPDYYIEASRDFQVLCRMYDFTLNSLKYNIDSMQQLTDTRNIKDTVLPLLGDKLGIYDKEAFSNRQLLDALPIAMKYKGSLKSIKILLNAFLDSMDVFENALALHSKDEESAAEISAILRRPIPTYSIVIILSTFPSLTNLHILDTYLNMVVPSGFIVEYGFGVQKEYFEKFKYKEYTFLFYTHRHDYVEEGITVPYISMIKGVHHVVDEIVTASSPEYKNVKKAMINPLNNTAYYYKIDTGNSIYYSNELPGVGNKISYIYEDKYSATFNYVGTDNITTIKELVGETEGSITYTLRHDAVPIPPATVPVLHKIDINYITGDKNVDDLNYEPSGKYSITIPENSRTYIEYSYNKTKEFIEEITSDVDINSVGLATVMSKDQYSEDR